MEPIIISKENEEEAKISYKQLYKNEKKQRENKEREIDYLNAKINILKNTHNKGEKDEVLLLIELFYLNQTEQYDKLVDIFGDEASDGIQILCMNTNIVITDISKLSKAKGIFKADCMIKMNKTEYIYCISIKSKNCANPAVLNHTPRTAKIFQQHGILYDYMSSLDIILKEYNDKRNNKIIGEDISITKLESLKNSLIHYDFMNVLSYFAFDGSGKGDSACKSNAIIHYEDEKIIFIKCRNIEEKRQYITNIYDRVIISLRDKGMPRVISEYCKPWLFTDCKTDGSIKYKGSLHIRIN